MLRPSSLIPWIAGLLVGAAVLACGPAQEPAAPRPRAEKQAPRPKVARFAQDPHIGVYTSIPWSFETHSYWIEGPDGLVVVDTQFQPSAAAEVIDAAESSTGKKVKLAVVLHPNPDKFNGTATFQARGVKVVTSAQVLAKIPAVHKQRKEAFFDRYKPDYPAEEPRPESFGAATTELSAGGVTLKAHVLKGPGCSEAHVVVEHDGHVFVGDLVGNGTHAWLEIGEAEEWLARLDEIKAMSPRFVHPGRGGSGGPELLDQQAKYLRTVLEEIAKEKPTLPIPGGALDRVQERIMKIYPGLGYPLFLEFGLPALWRKAAQRSAPPAGGG